MNSAAQEMLAQAGRLPPIPRVMQEVVRSLRNDNVTVAELAKIVHNDLVITAKVLCLANASYYGAGRMVASIDDAVQRIGLTAFRNRVIASSLASAFPRVAGFDLSAFWRNSMLVGNLAHVIGRDLEEHREMLFSAGLLHGIGQLLIYYCQPEAAKVAAAGLQDKPLEEQRAFERQLLRTDHFEIGMQLADYWDFPESIQLAIGHHDTPGAQDMPAQVVHAAVKIARGIQARQSSDEMLAALPPDIAARLRLDQAWFDAQSEVFEHLLQESAALV